jgi:hypothetical protein
MLMNLNELSRPLDISEVDFRVQSINNGGYATILAYKDARVDMNRLDEVLGPVGWQRDYKLIDGKLFCGVGIYSEQHNQWVWKWDVGTESNTEAEKGQASDAFKRACFNLGIGRELYDYPLIQVKLMANEWSKDGGKPRQTYDLKIKEWKWYSEFTDYKLSFLAAKDEKGNVRFKWGVMKAKTESYKAASGGEPTPENTMPGLNQERTVEEGNPAGLLAKKDDPIPQPIVVETVDKEREDLIQKYLELFGKKPHGKSSNDKIREEIVSELNNRMAEKLDEEEEPTMAQPEEVDEGKPTILNHIEEIDKFVDPKLFVAWAKQMVSDYVDIDPSDVLDVFKDHCNNHYSKIVQ